ncbi:UPF0175 family protein [Prosthecobacter sp.]|jgi:hypothetical protein|uniref:UPF0175 family protein n=1 Tax=Prosthecobacter sp. TaxID=1965333 RepID=UPI003782E0D8
MTVTLQIPDFIAASLHLMDSGREQRVLEALALEGYRSGDLSRGQVGEMLGMDYWDTEAFLKQHGAGYGLSADDLEKDRQELEKMLAAA